TGAFGGASRPTKMRLFSLLMALAAIGTCAAVLGAPLVAWLRATWRRGARARHWLSGNQRLVPGPVTVVAIARQPGTVDIVGALVVVHDAPPVAEGKRLLIDGVAKRRERLPLGPYRSTGSDWEIDASLVSADLGLAQRERAQFWNALLMAVPAALACIAI